MPGYRLFFFKEKSIEARDEFVADGDVSATAIANGLFAACSDEYSSWELWSGARRIADGALSHDGHFTRAIQEIVVEREQVLLESGRTTARSRRLLEKTNEMLAALGRKSVARRPA